MKTKSLRFKIISLFIILMIANAGFMSLTLYQSLKNELISRDNALLVNRADQLAKLINSGIDIKTLPIYFQRMMDMQQDIIYITDAHNKILVDTNSDILFTNHLKTVDTKNIDLNIITCWETESGVPVSAINFTIESPIGMLNVVIAKASIVRISMLSEYLSKTLIISLASILFMGILSFWLIKHGLRDIRFLSQITAKTDVHTLSQTINISQLPSELKSLGDSLNIMRKRLKNDFVKLTQLADDLAHELRTPINAIKVQNEIMLQRSRSVEEYESIIISNIEELDKLAKIIENILFIARAENKNIILNRETLNLSDLIDEIYNLFSFYAEEKQITLLKEPTTLTVSADHLLFTRILMNLISNAIKYSPVNTQVITQCKKEKNQLVICVSNIGDELNQQEKIFTRFWRGDNARTTDGNGLGLSIVQAIMTLHEGKVSYKRIGKHNVFILTFPC
ncbi:heavy metal sensor histidine kinase [Proteus columbae]|uniref:heavy metal sensor histidine kinase n=1 Tax=Proteus columbae TaxID=1987580 RepID=UPI000C1E82FD|nr:heavy metal sensor histidine kinase [Proteus columbae]